MSVTFTLPMPVSVNTAYANGGNGRGRHYTAKAKAWIQQAGIALNQQCIPALIPPYHVTYSYGRFPDKRRRDVSNYEKLLSDLLVKSCVIVDDSMINDMRVHWATDVEPGTVRVQIVGGAQ